MNTEIESYMNKRYCRWLDYSIYHCSQAGMHDEAVDVLNEVLISLLKKDENYLLALYSRKKGQYSELDFFVLKMIKLNCHSDTAPYRHKHKSILKDANVDLQSLDIEDSLDDEPDISAEYLEKFRDVYRVVERLDLSKDEKFIFNHAFVVGEPLSSFSNNTTTYRLYSELEKAITVILHQEGKIKINNLKISGRAKQLVKQYNLTKTY